ncbi:terminase [Ensifer aridi]|uniref:terminase n=1 Tax=Ensifer aridi TaxID=1708715 RepID=UPI0030B8298C
MDGLEKEVERILGTRDGYNSQVHKWRLPAGNRLQFAGMPNETDKEKYQGRQNDLKGWDEITQFTETQFRYVNAWNRDASGGRCRIVATGNPPTSAQGMWVIKYWAPWLDPSHPNPAAPGELRWFTTVDGEDIEVEGRGPHFVNGELVEAVSRTFIPSRLEDNPDLMATGYASRLNALPKELRERLRNGAFDVEAEDDPWQVIPTKWVKAAQARWTERPPEDVPMTAVAADVAQGGTDKTQIQSRYDWWYSRFSSYKGSETPDGPTVAGLIIKEMRDRCRVIVDAGGGYGGDTLTQLAHADVDCFGFKGGSGSASRTREGMYGFKNLRSQAVWQFREQLDPDYGSQIALPPDPELTADLCAFRYEIRAGGGGEEIVVLPKEDMKEMLGRSPDKGDTTIMLSASKLGGLKRPKAAQERRELQRQRLQSVTSNASMKARLRGKR